KDPDAVAVEHGQDRANDPARDAAVVEREVLESVERARPKGPAVAVGGARAASRCHGRHLSVRRIHDERRVPECPHTVLVPEDRLLVDSPIPRTLVTGGAAGAFLRPEAIP